MSLPLDLPLRGSQLIEASAGTGKTFTIALLYVRLVLGHGRPDSDETLRDNGYLRPLVPPEILVVTFTEAASLELRDRIRARLVQAAEAFRAEDEGDSLAERDGPLAALRAEVPQEHWPLCARRLQVAAEWMDDAAVSTIHSWAQKMLREHAFDSGKLFQQELVRDLTDQTLEAVTDYWRTLVYPLDEPLAAAMVALFGSPRGLQDALRNPLQRPDASLVFRGEPIKTGDIAKELAQASRSRQATRGAEEQARASYESEADALHESLRALRGVMNGTVFRGVKNDAVFEGWLEELAAWGQGELDLAEAGFVQKLARGRLKLTKGHELPDFALFDYLEAWRQSRTELDKLHQELAPRVLADARDWVTQRLEQYLKERAQMGFNDMISGLDEALAGPGGAALAQRIREQFPVAMIDEFQDTDPAQYRIFDSVYRVGDDAQDTGLILIGDPKQAIYGFRGGDIHTYLKARRATADRLHTLDTNYRSSRDAVAAANHLFAHAETHHPRAAFRFGPKDATPVPFQKVGAKGRKERLILDEAPTPALVGWMLEADEVINKTDYLRDAARHCADRIAQWLNQAQHGQAGFSRDEAPAWTPLKASDIAILVRDRTEATAIRQALSERDLSSVYLSDRDSVFATDEARDLLRWLRAMADPEYAASLKAALATATLGQPLAELDRLQRDELAWEALQETFIGYRQCWLRRGVLPALRCLLHDFRVPESLLAGRGGERALTNLLHLAEWAQQASDTLDGEHALVRLLAEHIEQPGHDEQILRLESDAELIQVVTIFKSKGLEYPIVALPFICTAKEVNGKRGAPLYHQDDRPLLELAGKKDMAREGFEQADDERLSEEMRLLYVALTRARHATFLGLAPLKSGRGQQSTLHKGALGYLLNGGEPIANLAALKNLWAERCEACPALHEEAVDGDAERTRYAPVQASPEAKAARSPSHAPFRPWWIASYSSLHLRGAGTPDTPQAEVRHEAREDDAPPITANQSSPSPGTLHAFPRGPEPGTFLHGALEAAAEVGFATAAGDDGLRRRLEHRCRLRGWEAHVPTLHAGLDAWLHTPLAPTSGDGPTLAKLARYRAEPDFWFPTADVTTPAMDKLIKAHILPGKSRPALGFHCLNGLMKGFIDLLAEHEGRFYVIDWKSNWLGPNDMAYRPNAMTRAMLDKRYDVQLAVYLLALHRHLRQTLPDYDYDHHVGGAMLVFLRGIGAPSRGVQAIKPPLAFLEALDDLMAGHRSTQPQQEVSS